MTDTHEAFLNERLDQIADRMKQISTDIEKRTKQLDLDIMSMRNDPEIKKLWNKLCLLHMKGIVICEEEYKGEKPQACMYLSEPQACITYLQLAEEQTCCYRLLKRLDQ